MANATKFVEALMEEARQGHLPPPFTRALAAAEEKAATVVRAKKTPRAKKKG